MASKSGSQSCCAESLGDYQPSTPSGEPTAVQATEPLHQEYDFVEEPPDEYFCPVTLELISDPKQTECCGHLLSGRLVSKLQREGKSCPLCNDPNFKVITDKHFKRKVNRLRVRCPHRQNGCEWVGELGDMEDHMTRCPLRLVACEFAQAGCQVRVPRQDMARHMEEWGQRHLLSVSLLNLSLTRELHQKMAEQIAELQEQMQRQNSKLERQVEGLRKQCKQIDRKLQTLLESELEDEDEIQGQYCGTYTFESVHFPGVYLRMDGNEVTEFVGPGGGVVNCQFGADAWEEFKLYHVDGCNYCIESVQFPGVYLRMDGSGLTTHIGPGGGVVNCQFGAGPWEIFKLIYNGADSSFSIQSVQFPGVHLRMAGGRVTAPSGPGGGIVNCQFGARSCEKFKLNCVDSCNYSIESMQFPGVYLPSGMYEFESVQFPGVYLRMDGNGVTESVGPGGGIVNCQFGAGPYEKFKLNCVDDCNYTIESVEFPQVYLRLDGSRVTKFTGPGSGVVNCQFGAGPWEKFRLKYHGADSSFSIQSVQFPGVYLRMDGGRVAAFAGPGGGVVNCQFEPGPYEKFKLKSA